MSTCACLDYASSQLDCVCLCALQASISASWVFDPNPSFGMSYDRRPFWPLRMLSCRDCQLWGALPSPWYMPLLQQLDLSGNALTGDFAPPLGGSSSYNASMREGLSYNSYVLPAQLVSVNLSGNSLEGSIDRPLLSWERLQVVDLGRNSNLTGTIPPGEDAQCLALPCNCGADHQP